MPSYKNQTSDYKNLSRVDTSASGPSSVADFGSNAAAQEALVDYKNNYGVESDVDYKNGQQGQADDAVEYKNNYGVESKIDYKNGIAPLGTDSIVGDLDQWLAEELEEGPAEGMSRMPKRYQGEDQKWRASRLDDTKQSKVHYMSEEEGAAASMKVADGKLLDAQGQDLTTAGQHEILRDSMENAHIWGMGADSEVRHADPKPIDVDATHHEVMHHSSLFAGADLKCAGEMQVKDGFVKEINNHSGHYRPEDAQLLDAVGAMSAQGVNTDMTKVHEEKSGNDFFGAEYLATGGDRAKADQKQAVNEQIKGFDKSKLKSVA